MKTKIIIQAFPFKACFKLYSTFIGLLLAVIQKSGIFICADFFFKILKLNLGTLFLSFFPE